MLPCRYVQGRNVWGRHVSGAWFRAGLWAGVPLLAIVVAPSHVTGQALSDALIAAYRHNPGLQSQRFEVRASDEAVPRALSGYRPRVAGDAFLGVNAARDDLRSRGGTTGDKTYGYGLKIEQPLFDGFQTLNGVREAEAGVRASRHELKAAENELLLQTARAYLNVLRDEGVVLYRRKNLTALKRELVGVREQLGGGQNTVTDLEQVRRRLATAQSDLTAASGALDVSGLQFARLTGRAPSRLRMPKLPRNLLPASLREATTLALAESPIIAAARHKQDAAGHAVARVRGELLPSANLVGGYDRSFNDAAGLRDQDTFSLVGRVRVPLYQAGEVSARVRQARHTASARDRETAEVRATIAESVGAAWSELATARERVKLERQAIAAAERALRGVREEYRLGRRTVADVLDAERELLDARLRILNTQRDLHVSAYALLRAVGGLTIERISPQTERYDPKQHYRKVRGKWFGTASPVAGGTGFLGQKSNELSGATPLGRGWAARVTAGHGPGNGTGTRTR